MNVLLAPFLYLMPEVDAFYTFKQFAQKCIPLYLNAGITAAYTGMRVCSIFRFFLLIYNFQ